MTAVGTAPLSDRGIEIAVRRHAVFGMAKIPCIRRIRAAMDRSSSPFFLR